MASSSGAGSGRVSETREDWMVVIASTVALAFSVSHVYSMGILIGPLEAEFGWARGQITGGLAVVSVVSVILAPFVGMAVDRYGSRRVGLPGIVVYFIAIALLSTASAPIWHWWSLWALVALGSVLIKPTVWVAAIAGRFEARRGVALAVALCGTSIGSAILPYLTGALLTLGGWRGAYLALSLTAALVALPMIYFFFWNASPARGDAAAAAPRRPPGLTIRAGLSSAFFMKMAVASLLVTMAILSLTVHFVPIMISRDMPALSAASIAGAIGIGSIIGRLGTGFLLDRFPGQLVGAASFGLPILVCVLLVSFDTSIASATVIAILLGLSLGAEIDVIAFLSARYFGLANYGLLFGTLAGLISLGAGLGPTFAGIAFDHFQSYDIFVLSLIPLLGLGAVLVASLGRPPSFDTPKAPD